MGAKLKHKCSRIFPARTVPAPTILSRKDGARRLPLAPVQTLDKVFSIPTLGSRSDDRIKPPLFPRSAEDWQPRRHFRIRRIQHQSHNSNCWWRYFGRTLQARIAIEKPPNVGRESSPVALPYSPHLPTITPSVQRAEPARWRPPK